MDKRLVNINYRKMAVDKLGIYIMDIQHPYLKKALATFQLCTGKISDAGEKQPGVNILTNALVSLGQLVEQHLAWEEQVFFPWARLRIEHKITDLQPAIIKKILSDHKQITRLTQKARLMSDDYIPPCEASPRLKLCYAQLFDFEQDMLKHIFLEEQLLLPQLFNKQILYDYHHLG